MTATRVPEVMQFDWAKHVVQQMTEEDSAKTFGFQMFARQEPQRIPSQTAIFSTFFAPWGIGEISLHPWSRLCRPGSRVSRQSRRGHRIVNRYFRTSEPDLKEFEGLNTPVFMSW